MFTDVRLYLQQLIKNFIKEEKEWKRELSIEDINILQGCGAWVKFASSY